MMRPRHTVLVAHLNDGFNGASKMAALVASTLKAKGYAVRCLVGSAGDGGFLRQHHDPELVPYALPSNRALALLRFIHAQVCMYRRVRKACQNSEVDLVWVNTVLPTGAAVAAWRSGVPVVAHLHEVGLGTPVLFRLTKAVLWRTASEFVCVSDYVGRELHTPAERCRTIYNCLGPQDEDLARNIAASSGSRPGAFTVLMACSVRPYKGIHEFVALAARFQGEKRFRFQLVLSGSEPEFDAFVASQSGANVEFVHSPKSMYAWYEQADLVLNLSRRREAIESFGLTLLEAMACGVPVVSPLQGGCTELFEHGEGGWRIDSGDLAELEALIVNLAGDPMAHARAREGALRCASAFSYARFGSDVQDVVDKVLARRAQACRLAFIGAVGIPNRYGGFESFLENCAPKLADRVSRVTVTCDPKHYVDRCPTYGHVFRLFIPVRANGGLSVVHDLLAFLAVFPRATHIIVLGVSAGPWFPLFRIACDAFGKQLFVNVDGIEWRRVKFGRLRRMLLRSFDFLAQTCAHKIIIDNRALLPYVPAARWRKTHLISYSGDHVTKREGQVITPGTALTVCRIEPENNVDMLIEGFLRSRGVSYTVVGNWQGSAYGRRLRAKYAGSDRLHLLDPIYDPEKLGELRGSCQYYLHGHGVGGTNPSLVEMTYYDCGLLCFDCAFNRETAGNEGRYFANADDIQELLDSSDAAIVDCESRQRLRSRYTRDEICSLYMDLLLGAAASSSLGGALHERKQEINA